MAFINHRTKEINCKIVYYGAGRSGKTTNLCRIYAQTSPNIKGKMVSLPSSSERTLYFDFLPLSLGSIRGYKIRLHLYSVPGQIFYDASRKLILQGVDGVVFVVDSQKKRLEANIESFNNLWQNISKVRHGQKLSYILQYNKRDLTDLNSINYLQKIFNKKQLPYFLASAYSGNGVFDTLKSIGKLVVKNISSQSIN